jgi:hypothetical protein
MRAPLSGLMWLAAGALAALLVIEGIFRLLPVPMGLYRTEQFDRWPLQGYQPGQSFTSSETWQMLNVRRGKTNNYGHRAPFDYRVGSHPVIVVGDSYVASPKNVYEESIQGRLGEHLGSRESVYGLAFTGLSASDYLALSRLAKAEFAPSAAVFVVIDGDLSESLPARLGYYHFVPQGDSFRLEYLPLRGETLGKAVRKTIGEISLYRYIYDNLGFSSEALFKFGRSGEQPQPARVVGDAVLQRRMVDYFLAELPRALGVPPRCIAFLVDSDRYAIYDPRSPSEPKETPEVRRYFLDQAQESGFAVSDLDPVFRARYARDRTKFDFWPMDRHWNRTGHSVAADEAYRLLFGAGKRECLPGLH